MSINVSKSSFRSPLGKILRLPLKLIPKNAKIPVMQGPLKGAKWIAGSHIHGCWLGTYELEKQDAFVKFIKPGQVVCDIGANVGFNTLLSSRLVGPQGKVLSFEPVPRNLALLRQRVEMNHCANVTVFDAAVSNAAGEATFSEGANSANGSLGGGGTLRVRVVCLDDLLRDGVIAPPNLLKIDVEGAEAMVLQGAKTLLETHHPTIFLATHGTEAHNQCIDILRGFGYTLASMDEFPLESTREVLATH